MVGALHQLAPARTPPAGANPVRSGPCCGRDGIPAGWAADGANRCDRTLFESTLAAAERGLLADVETLHLDRGYDTDTVRACAAEVDMCTG